MVWNIYVSWVEIDVASMIFGALKNVKYELKSVCFLRVQFCVSPLVVWLLMPKKRLFNLPKIITTLQMAHCCWGTWQMLLCREIACVLWLMRDKHSEEIACVFSTQFVLPTLKSDHCSMFLRLECSCGISHTAPDIPIEAIFLHYTWPGCSCRWILLNYTSSSCCKCVLSCCGDPTITNPSVGYNSFMNFLQ